MMQERYIINVTLEVAEKLEKKKKGGESWDCYFRRILSMREAKDLRKMRTSKKK